MLNVRESLLDRGCQHAVSRQQRSVSVKVQSVYSGDSSSKSIKKAKLQQKNRTLLGDTETRSGHRLLQPSLQVGPTLVVPLYESPRTLSPVTVCPLAFTCQKLIHSLHLYTPVPVSLYSRPDKNSKWRLVGLVRALLIPLEGSECDQDDSACLFSFWDQPHSRFPLCLLVVILPACSLVAADEWQLHFHCHSFVKVACFWAITFINVSCCCFKR